jgi:hypothetical protein
VGDLARVQDLQGVDMVGVSGTDVFGVLRGGFDLARVAGDFTRYSGR